MPAEQVFGGCQGGTLTVGCLGASLLSDLTLSVSTDLPIRFQVVTDHLDDHSQGLSPNKPLSQSNSTPDKSGGCFSLL